jgi:hypothetical protein
MNWTPPRLRIAAIVAAALVACGTTADDDATDVDAGLDVDAASDGRAPICVTTGDGGLYAQCCVFDDACAGGNACYWLYGEQAGADDGACFPPGAVAIGATCDLTNNACVPGAFCLWDENTPMTGTGTCRTLCNPANPSCGADERCEVPFGDGTIGFCTGGAP